MGVVKYIDYESDIIDASNLLSAFVHKGRSYEHEREVRALVVKFPLKNGDPDPGGFGSLDFSRETIAHGVEIKVDIERLIERIYVAPSAPEWFADLVRALINRYGYVFEVVHSKLDEQTLF